MSSPSQRRGGYGHMMAGFDQHSVCVRSRDGKKGSDPCVETPPAACMHCDSLFAEQKEQLSTPSYKLKKEKRDAKSSNPAKDIDTLSPPLWTRCKRKSSPPENPPPPGGENFLGNHPPHQEILPPPPPTC